MNSISNKIIKYDVNLDPKLDNNIFEKIVNYDVDNFFTKYPKCLDKMDFLITTNKYGHDNKNICIIMDYLIEKSFGKIYKKIDHVINKINYNKIYKFIEYIFFNNKIHLFEQSKDINFYFMYKILLNKDQNEMKKIYFDFIEFFVKIHCNKTEDLTEFLKFIKEPKETEIENCANIILEEEVNNYEYDDYIDFNSLPFEKFINEISKTDILILDIITNNPNDDYYRMYYYIMKYHDGNKKEDNYMLLYDLILKEYDMEFKLVFLEYLIKCNILLDKKKLFDILILNKSEYFFIEPNYKENAYAKKINNLDDGYDLLVIEDIPKENKYYSSAKKSLFLVLDTYHNKKIINKDEELFKLLIENNSNIDYVKLYDDYIMNLIDSNNDLISENIMKYCISNHNFYVILHLLNKKYILSDLDINLIFENSLCIDELFDVIFTQYLEKTKENLEKWYVNHKKYYNLLDKFDLKIDDSYLDLFFGASDELINGRLDWDLRHILYYKKYKFDKKLVKFYFEFLKKPKFGKITIDKIEKLINKTKKTKLKVNNICIENMLKAGYDDELVDEIIWYYKIPVNNERMMLLSNSYKFRKYYYDKIKKTK